MRQLMRKAITALAVAVGITTAAQAAEPVATWTDFSNPTSGDYTLTIDPSCYVGSDGSVIIGANGGLTLALPDGDAIRTGKKVTIVAEVENILPTGDARTLFAIDVTGNNVNLTKNKDNIIYQKWNGNAGYNNIGNANTVGRAQVAFVYSNEAGTDTWVEGAKKASKDNLKSGGGAIANIYIGSYNGTTQVMQGLIVRCLKIYAERLTARADICAANPLCPNQWFKFNGNYDNMGAADFGGLGEAAGNWNPGIDGQAMKIVNGSTHPYGGSWSYGSGAWAVTTVAKPIANASDKIVLWATGTKGNGWFGLVTDSANNKVILCSSSNAEICSVEVPDITDFFHLYTVRCDGNGNFELIVDGDIAGKGTAEYSTAVPSGSFQIGAVQQGCPSGYARTTGTLIDDLRVYTRALADDEIETLAARFTTPETISVNIGGGRGTGDLAANSDHLVQATDCVGLAPAVGAAWNNLAKQWQSGAGTKKFTMDGVKASEGTKVITRSGITVNMQANNTYDGGAGRVNAFHKGYLDDGQYDGRRAYVKVTDIPYSRYDVIVYAATDSSNRKYGPMKVNGTAYTWKDGCTKAGTDAWGDSNGTATEYATNAIVVQGISTAELEIEGTMENNGRGGIAAVQIVNRGTVSEKHVYEKTMTESCNFSDLFEEGEFVPGSLTYVTVTVDAAEPLTLTMDDPTVELAKITVVSENAFTLKSTAGMTKVGLTDFSGVTGKLTLGTGCVNFAPATIPAAGLRLEGTTPVAQIPYMAAGYAAQLEIACPVTSVGNGGAFVGNKNVVFDEGCAISDTKFSIGNQANTSQHFEQRGGTITLTDNANGQSNNGPMLLGHWNGTDRWYKLTGGTLTAPNGVIRLGWDGGCALTVGGGETAALLSTKGIRAGSERSIAGSSLTVGANGTVSLGANGIYIGTDNIPLTLAGGKITSYGYATVTKGTIDVTVPSTLAAEAGKTLTMAAAFNGDSVVTVGTADETGTVIFSGAIPTNLTVAAGTAQFKAAAIDASGITVYGGLAVFADRTAAPTVTGGNVGYYVTVNDLGSFTVPGEFDVSAVKLFNGAGQEVTITEADPETRKIAFEMDRYGKSCLMEYLYEGNLNSTGSDTGSMQFDGTHCFTGAEYVTNDVGEAVGGIYAASAPWRNVSFPSDVTVVMYGKVMKTSNTCQIGIGSTTGGSKYSLFLASGDVSKEEVVLGYAYKNVQGAANVEASGVLCRMTVPHAQTTEHLYAFTLSQQGGKTVVKIYLDGEVLQPYEFPSTVTLGDGIQLGSIHGGVGPNQDWPEAFGFKRSTAVETEATLQFLRVYDGVLNDTVMRAIAEDYPYESPAGSFNRTFAGNGNWTEENAWSKVGEDTKYDAPEAGSAVTITPPASDMTLTVNLDETESFEAFTANVGGKVTVVRGADCAGSANVAGRSTISTDMTVDATVLTFGGNVAVAAGKTLTFDCGSIDLTKYYANDTIKLTGVPTLGEGAVIDAINVPTDVAGRTAEFAYDTASQQYVINITVKGSLTAAVADTAKFSELVWTMGEDEVTPDWSVVGKANLAVAEGATLDLDTTVSGVVTLEADNDLAVVKSCAEDVTVTLKAATGKKILVPVEDGETLEALPCAISGTVCKTGAGTLAVAVDHAFVVSEGTLKATAAGTVAVTVGADGTFDLNGISGSAYTITLDGGALVNTGARLNDVNTFTTLTLTADSTLGGTFDFTMQKAGYAATTINLGEYTLTKEGTNKVSLVTTTINGTGTLYAKEGTVYSSESTSFANGVLKIGEAGTFLQRSDRTLTVANVVGEGGTLDNAGTVSAFTLTGSLKLVGAGTYGTITLGEGAALDIGQKRGLTLAGAGTVAVDLTQDEFNAGTVTVFTSATGATTAIGKVTYAGQTYGVESEGGRIIRIKKGIVFFIK